MPLRVVNVAEEVARLTEPFSLIELAYVVPKGMVHRLAPGDGAVVMLLERQVPTSGGG